MNLIRVQGVWVNNLENRNQKLIRFQGVLVNIVFRSLHSSDPHPPINLVILSSPTSSLSLIETVYLSSIGSLISSESLVFPLTHLSRSVSQLSHVIGVSDGDR